MSARRLGGGRILGSGKGLGPDPPAVRRASSPLAISESNFSQTSSSVSPPASGSFSDFGQDIGSNISVGAQPRGSDADASALVCPICNEGMLTLLQLNRHIDDNHQELPAEEQNEVKTWFDKQVLKAKRFQPLSLINMKLRGLDVFESNESNPAPPAPTASTAAAAAAVAGAALKLPLDPSVDPDEVITQGHWQRSTPYDLCTDPACGRGLGPINGSINCRKCGRLFCEEHTMYQMKLSRSANHEPVRGYWARVCETCYKSREGYNDHDGALVDHTSSFVEARRKRLERQNLEVSRLEKRLTKLTRLLVASPEALAPPATASLLGPVSSLTGQKNARKAIEQSVVTWEEDDKVSQCPFCHQEFGSWTFRRHHCRVCGRVVCGDPQTSCSSEVSLNVAHSVDSATEKPPGFPGGGTSPMDIRMCRECNHTIFSGRDFAASLLHKPPDQRAYETLCQFERGIRLLLPSFHRSLLALRPEIQEASKIRKRLIDGFTKYGSAAKRMRDLKADNPTQERLQAAVYAYANNFLHINMLPLKSVPHMLRRRSLPSHSGHQFRRSSAPYPFTSGLRYSEVAESETASQAPSEASTVVSQLETEEKDLRERLAVLEEQKFMVQEMVRTATGARRFEEVSALSRNADELDGEIAQLRSKIGDVEQRWEDVYRSGNA
ncbi:Vacuolar segregation protein PEP7 [Escovopsis weberi]|uniref:Vacuolar segregation protein PEP7 n=1 Tax=Escovopsis weberi TaxID=150374 RepID=A0A0M8NA29_ESCWE|nr:Vacuolar segregation protein PEP7 [Escovopsis weberi]